MTHLVHMQLLPDSGKNTAQGLYTVSGYHSKSYHILTNVYPHTIKLRLHKQKQMALINQLWLFNFFFYLSEET